MDESTRRGTRLPRAPSARHVRRWVQVIALLLFLTHIIATRFPLPGGFPAEALFRTDPLVALGASLAAREVASWVWLALPIVVLTVVFGRAFCGWLCPLGTLIDVFRLDDRSRRVERSRLRGASHFILLVLLTGAAFGSLTLFALHPLTLLFRAVTLGVLPAVDHVATTSMLALYGAGVLPDAILAIDSLLRPAILPAQSVDYRGGALAFGLLAGVLALNLAAPRFWCRYLCPLGAFLGIGARVAPFGFRIGPECTHCGHCSAQCKTAAIAPKSLAFDASACVDCFDCLDECPEKAIRFDAARPEPRYSPSRRKVLAGVGLGIAGVAVARVDSSAAAPDSHLVRPPGAGDDIASRCIRCGACLRVCPTAALHPAGLETGLDGIWTPLLISRLGNCEWTCNACGQVCPTGAIRPLDLTAKRAAVIGSAYIDQNRCLPWADVRDCIVCQEMCPLPEKAIVLAEVSVADARGVTRTVRRPIVDRLTCIGCGACENRCPVPGEAAIRVRATGVAVTSARN